MKVKEKREGEGEEEKERKESLGAADLRFDRNLCKLRNLLE